MLNYYWLRILVVTFPLAKFLLSVNLLLAQKISLFNLIQRKKSSLVTNYYFCYYYSYYYYHYYYCNKTSTLYIFVGINILTVIIIIIISIMIIIIIGLNKILWCIWIWNLSKMFTIILSLCRFNLQFAQKYITKSFEMRCPTELMHNCNN